MNTFGDPSMIGPPTWGTGPVDSGQVCMSVRRAAGFSPAMIARLSRLAGFGNGFGGWFPGLCRLVVFA